MSHVTMMAQSPLGLLAEAFSWFTFEVIIDRYVLTDTFSFFLVVFVGIFCSFLLVLFP